MMTFETGQSALLVDKSPRAKAVWSSHLRVNSEIRDPSKLDQALLSAWQKARAHSVWLGNPLLSPGFTRLLASIRSDARLGLVFVDDQLHSILPFHQRPFGRARPIGAPFSDISAILQPEAANHNAPKAPVAAILRALNIAEMRVQSAWVEDGDFAARGLLAHPSYAMMAQHGEIEETIRRRDPKRIKNYRRLEAKIGREIGDLRFEFGPINAQISAKLCAWKRHQYAQTGADDVLRPAWTQKMLAELAQTPAKNGEFGGFSASLWAGDRLIAGHLGVREGANCNPWIAAFDPELAAFSPGALLLLAIARHMDDANIPDPVRHYALGTGHGNYKTLFSTAEILLGEGYLRANPRPKQAFNAPLLRKTLERLDHIASVELTVLGRAGALARAGMGLFASGRRARATEAALG